MLHGKQEPNPLHHNLLLPLYVCPAVIIAASQIPEAGDQIGEFFVITVWVFYAAFSLAISPKLSIFLTTYLDNTYLSMKAYLTVPHEMPRLLQLLSESTNRASYQSSCNSS